MGSVTAHRLATRKSVPLTSIKTVQMILRESVSFLLMFNQDFVVFEPGFVEE